MNTLPLVPFRQRQRGVTLVELMVALTIGLFVIGAALMAFQNISGVGSQISEVAQIRQEGAHAFRVIGKQVREAGSVEPEYVSANNNFRFNNYSWVGGNPFSSRTPSGADSDFGVLSISQQMQTAAIYQERILDCLGNEIAVGGGSSTSGYSDFYVSNGQLMCSTSSSAASQPIVSNVHAFAVQYRVRASNNSKERQFVETPSNWGLVDAVEVCLDLVGTKATPTDNATYTDCEGDIASHDSRLHVVQRNLFTVFSAQR